MWTSTINETNAMGLVRAIIVTAILSAIMYVLRTRFIDATECEMQVSLLTWIPFVLFFFYLLL